MRLVVAGFVTAVLVIGGYRWRSRRSEKPVAVPQPLPSNVSQQLSGYSFTRSDNGRQIFTVHASRTVAFQGDVTVLNDVSVEVFGRTGRQRDLIRTRSCNYNRQTGELFAEGEVEIELNAPANVKADDIPTNIAPLLQPGTPSGSPNKGEPVPVYLETSHLTFARQGSMVVTDAPVRFRAADASGTAQGLAYATRDDWIELKKNVVMEMSPAHHGSSSSPIRLEAARLRFEKATGIVTLWGPVEISQEDRHVSAANGRVQLDARNRVTRSELNGDVKAHFPLPQSLVEGTAQNLIGQFDPGTNQLRRMQAEGGVQAVSIGRGKVTHLSAQELSLDFTGIPSEPEKGIAEGNVQMISEQPPTQNHRSDAAPKAASRPGASKGDLTASAVRFRLALGGKSLREAETVGPGKMILVSGNSKSGPRVVSANPFVFDFDARSRPTTLRGLSDAKIVFMPASTARAGTPPAVTTSDKLLATFDADGSTLRTIDQAGHFRFEQGNQRGFADNAHDDATTDIVTLTGNPRVEDDQTHARADRIVIETQTGDAQGFGHVQTSHLDMARKAASAKTNDPTKVVADRMDEKRQSQFVHYEGNVRVWHDGDVMQSEAIDVFKGERKARTKSRVLTSFIKPARETAETGSKASGPGSREAMPVIIRADSLEYADEARKAVYRGNVQLDSENATLRADRMDVFFSEADKSGTSEIDHAMAEGRVTVIQPGRRATGDRAEYYAEPERIILLGGPPTLYDAEKGFTTGRQLTFFLRDDTIFLDGGDQSPTLSKHRLPQ